MKNSIFISILSTLIFMSSCTKDDQIFGSGDIVSESRNVSDFTKFNSSGIFEVNITQGESQSVEIMADDNIINQVRTEVVNNELRLYLDNDDIKGINLKANITVKKLDAIKNSGTGNIMATNVNSNARFSVSNSGTGNVEITGSAESLFVDNEGSGNYLGFDFVAENVKAKNRGSGSIETSCSKSLDVSISGSGNVYYKGNPSVNISSSGSGKAVKVN